MPAVEEERFEVIRAALAAAEVTWGEHGEAVLETGLAYAPHAPIHIRVRKRGRRYDLSDYGVATHRAGRPDGWLGAADRVVAREGFNVNRTGVVFVPVVEGRDLAALVLRLAESSLDVHLALLELEADQRER